MVKTKIFHKVLLAFALLSDELGIDLGTCQMPLNVYDSYFESFQHKILPIVLMKKDLKKLPESDMKKLEKYAKPYAGMIVENYKRKFK